MFRNAHYDVNVKNQKSYHSKRVGAMTITSDGHEVTIVTARLKITSLNQHDSVYLKLKYTHLFTQPNNVALYRKGSVWSDEEIDESIQIEQAPWNTSKQFGDLIIEEIQSGEFVGVLSITYRPNEYSQLGIGHPMVAEIGYILEESFWGKGYGTEAAIAAKKYIKHMLASSFLDEAEMPVREIVATVHPNNAGSNAILSKTLKRKEPEAFERYGSIRMFYYKPLKMNRIIVDEQAIVDSSVLTTTHTSSFTNLG